MTTQFIEFNEFKRLILEASSAMYKGGFYWAFRCPDKDKEPKKWIMSFYLSWQPSEKDETSKKLFEKWIDQFNQAKPGNTDVSKFEKINDIAKVQENIENKYSLYTISYALEFNTLDVDKSLTYLKEHWNRITKEQIGNSYLNVYTYCELQNTNNSKDGEITAAKDLIKMMIYNPERFTGHEDLDARLEKVNGMSNQEFMNRYSSEGPIQALIAKQILKGLAKYKEYRKNKKPTNKDKDKDKKKKTSLAPIWKDTFKDFDININTAGTINLAYYIENYEKNKDKINITVSPENDAYYKIVKRPNGTPVFTMKFFEANDFTIEFNLTCDKYPPDKKTIKIHVKNIGESIIK